MRLTRAKSLLPCGEGSVSKANRRMGVFIPAKLKMGRSACDAGRSFDCERIKYILLHVQKNVFFRIIKGVRPYKTKGAPE